MAWRLAQRGHEVTVYAPLDKDCPEEWKGTLWRDISQADIKEDVLWILVRCPNQLRRNWGGRIWIVLQDVDYPFKWTKRPIEKVEKIICMSNEHGKYFLKAHPELQGKVFHSKNAARIDLLEEVEREDLTRWPRKIQRNPNKLIYTSSPDRGLVQAVLPLWPKIRHFVPDAELHIFYGFTNIDIVMEEYPEDCEGFIQLRKDFDKLVQQPGVHFHGRVGQRDLYRHYLESSIWPYFSDFMETSCIASMEAQAAGAIPVTRPFMAVGEHVQHGCFVNGSCYNDPLTRDELVAHTARLLIDTETQDQIRPWMMEWARGTHHWERVVDQWEGWLNDYPETAFAQYNYQWKHRHGATLNVGCNNDISELGKGPQTVNVDIAIEDEWTKDPIPVNLLADGRKLPFGDSRFDTVILGDILEHCDDGNATHLIHEAKRVGRNIVATCPEDHGAERKGKRANEEGRPGEYIKGVAAYHCGLMTKERLTRLLGKPENYQPIRYWDCNGHGMTIRC